VVLAVIANSVHLSGAADSAQSQAIETSDAAATRSASPR
jgi:hypothetical protein